MLARCVNRKASKLPGLIYSRCLPAASSSSDAALPRPIRPEYPSPVRYGFIPEEWFTFFYPKTGVTGPYAFGITVGTYLVSKEWYVLEHEFYSGLSLAMVLIYLIKKVGPGTAKFLDKEIDEYESNWEASRKSEIQNHHDMIEKYKKEQWRSEAVSMLIDVKKTNIAIQLEAAYRERLQKAYQEVKKRLDYQLQMQTVERQFAQKNMVKYIVDNVKKAFTPEQEKLVLAKCISDLQGLVQKA